MQKGADDTEWNKEEMQQRGVAATAAATTRNSKTSPNSSNMSPQQRQEGSRQSPADGSDSEPEDTRIQPWQSLMDEIARQGSLAPPGSDYFPCQDGFHAHSLAG